VFDIKDMNDVRISIIDFRRNHKSPFVNRCSIFQFLGKVSLYFAGTWGGKFVQIYNIKIQCPALSASLSF